MLSNTLRLKFCYLKIIDILHPRYRLKIIGHIQKISKRTNLSVLMKMEMKVKNKSHRHDLNRPSFRHGKNTINIKSVSV